MVATALTIAGSDSGGGAGIQADLKTFAALGVYGASVVTALTAQNTREVAAVEVVSPRFVSAQIDAVMRDLRVDAVKIGMLGSAAVVEAVAAALEPYRPRAVVLDPVMASTSGRRLLEPDAVAGLRRRLLPIATVVTPNLAEAAVLLDRAEPAGAAETVVAARRLRDLGPAWVLVTGGEGGGGESVDLLAGPDGEQRFAAPRIDTVNTHGSGCTLASAVAAGLAQGMAVPRAVARAKAYVTAAIEAADALALGRGRGPLHHFHAWWNG